MRPNRVSIRTGFIRPEVDKTKDPEFWAAHDARIDRLAARIAGRRPENWPHGRQLAILMIQRSHMALDCIAHLQGVRASQEDFAWLRSSELAVKPLAQRFHQLTPEGKRIARDVCFAVAKRLGLHHVTYHLDRWTEHKARCTCGWHQSLSRRMNVNARGYLEERARRHLADPEAWKTQEDRATALIENLFPTRSESADAIDDATEVYGEWPEIEDICDASPNGHHEFNALSDPETCKHCKRKT